MTEISDKLRMGNSDAGWGIDKVPVERQPRQRPTADDEGSYLPIPEASEQLAKRAINLLGTTEWAPGRERIEAPEPPEGLTFSA